MAYDAALKRVVLFGGHAGHRYFPDTWEWNGSNWDLRVSTSSPQPRAGHAMTYDEARGRVVLFGGSDFNGQRLDDTWERDGSNWTKRSPTMAPPARWQHAMAYDAARERVVLFGGTGDRVGLQDTWEWDGSNWNQRFPASSPASLHYVMGYDPLRGRIVLAGGVETWEWDGSNWSQRSPASSPPARSAQAIAYDKARERVVLFGGFDTNDVSVHTFAYSVDLRPGIVATFDWSSTGTSSTAIDRLTVTAAAGGRGYTIVVPGTGTAVPGAELDRWDAYAGRWLPTGPPNQADSNAPATLIYGSRTRSEAQRMIDSDGQVHFRFRPTRGSGNGPDARVGLDYVELKVHYVTGSGDPPVCGNGKIELSNRELCDDGNTANGDGCAADCNIEYGWSCSGEPSVCTVCGNGMVEGAEQCDDGNLINGDGCNDACLIEPGWTCTGPRSICSRGP